MGWSEGSLLSLGVEVFWVFVKHKLSNFVKRVIGMRPDLSQIVDVETIIISICDWHNLSIPSPGWELTLLNGVVKIHCGVILGDLAHISGCLSSEVLDTLIGLVMILYKEFLALSINPLEGMRAVSVHVSESIGSSTIRHQNGHLMERLGRVTPEVPGHVGVLNTGSGVSLLAVNEVGELDGILDEKHWGVVSDHIIISFFGVMLDGESTRIAVAVVSTTLTSYS